LILCFGYITLLVTLSIVEIYFYYKEIRVLLNGELQMSIIFSDTGCDIPSEIIEKYGINIIHMPFTLGDTEYTDSNSLTLQEFYKQLREGKPVKTSSLNPSLYCEIFEPYLKEGQDIIYVHFSGQMSGTFNQLTKAIEELREKYPERLIDAIDSLNISAGGGLLAWEVAQRNHNGTPHKELVQWANQNKSNYSCYFYVDDLKHLKRGGRISATTAFVGAVLNIKPILHCAKCGQLRIIGKAMGRKKALSELLDCAKDNSKNIKDHPIVILHSDSAEQAEELKNMFLEEFGADTKIYLGWVGTTVGTHCGPGTIGLFFYGPQKIID